MVKVVRRSLMSTFIAFFILGAILQIPSLRESVRQYLIETVKNNSDYTVDIESIRLYPSFKISAHCVSLKKKESTLIKSETISVQINPFALINKRIHLRSVELDGLTILNRPTETREEGSFPCTVQIDRYFLKDLTFDLPELSTISTPISIKGSLSINPKNNSFYTNFKLQSSYDQDHWYPGDFSYENGEGSFLIRRDKNSKLDFEYNLATSEQIRIPRIHASWNALNIVGNLALKKDGTIARSSFFIASDDLSIALPISGSLFGDAKIAGNISDPHIKLHLHSEALEIKGEIFKEIELSLKTEGDEKNKSGQLMASFNKDGEAYQFTTEATWDHDNRWYPNHLRLKLPLEEIGKILNWDLAKIGGDFILHFHARNHQIEMEAELIDALVESYELGGQFSSINAIASGDTNQIVLRELSARDADNGIYKGKGTLLIDAVKKFPFTLNLELQNAYPFESDIYKSLLNGTVTLSGNLKEAFLAGSIQATKTQFRIPEKISGFSDSVKITYINQPEYELAPTRFQPETVKWPVALDLDVQGSGSIKIKGPNLTSSWKGGAQITGSIKKPKINGDFKLIKGKYVLRGKNFLFREGLITINGDFFKKSTLFIAAEMDLGETKIKTLVSGPLLNPSITLRSNPPLSQRAILSWILFNKGVTEISPMEEKQLSRSIRSLAEKADTQPDFLTKVGDVLGLDHVEIGGSPTGKGDLTVRVGKYLTEGTYLSLSRNISQGKSLLRDSSTVGIESRIGTHLRLRAEGDSESNGLLNILWKNDY